MTMRLKPNEARKWLIVPRPEAAWKELETLAITFDPPVKEMLVTRTSQIIGEGADTQICRTGRLR